MREIALAAQVGRGPQADAYNAAFQLPDLLNHILATAALSVAFIPLYRRALERDGEASARAFFHTVLGTLTALAALAAALLFVFAEPLIALQFGSFPPEQQALTVRLTRIVLPAQIFFVAGGLLRARLMAHGRFAAQAAAPLIYNLCIIAFGLLGAEALGVAGFAWGALVGAALGPLGAALWEARRRFAIRLRRLRFAPRDPGFLRFAALALPLLAGVTLLTVDEWFDRWFGGALETGAIATLIFARRLMQAPVGLVGQAVGTAALPALSRLHEQGRSAELAALVQRTMQVVLSLGVLAGSWLWCAAEPLVRLVYVRGAFSLQDAAPVAAALQIFALAIPGWALQTVAVRPFYARGDTWRPMLLGSAVALLAIPLYAALSRSAGVNGLAGAGAIAISANALFSAALARRLHGAPRLLPLGFGFARSAAVSATAALFAAWLHGQCAPWLQTALADFAAGSAPSAVLAAPAASAGLSGAAASAAPIWLLALAETGLVSAVWFAVALPLFAGFGDAPTRALLTRALSQIAGLLRRRG